MSADPAAVAGTQRQCGCLFPATRVLSCNVLLVPRRARLPLLGVRLAGRGRGGPVPRPPPRGLRPSVAEFSLQGCAADRYHQRASRRRHARSPRARRTPLEGGSRCCVGRVPVGGVPRARVPTLQPAGASSPPSCSSSRRPSARLASPSSSRTATSVRAASRARCRGTYRRLAGVSAELAGVRYENPTPQSPAEGHCVCSPLISLAGCSFQHLCNFTLILRLNEGML